MSDDRRTSIRRRVTLPFNVAEIEPDSSTEALCGVLAVPRVLALRAPLADLDDEFSRSLAGVSDGRTAESLRALARKVSVLEELLLAELPLPAAVDLELSADGVGFDAAQPLQVGGWVAVHLVLPDRYHLVAAARVNRCTPSAQPAGGYRIGAEFHGLEAPSARRLTRFAISREQ